ncbi:MAG: hypothetical protein AAGG68_04460 [Bacteroidota bacterium]
MRSFTIITIFLITASFAFAQTTLQPRKLSNQNRGIIYNSELAADVRLQTNGWSVGVNWGTLRTYYLTRYYYVDFGERKHLKELTFNPGVGRQGSTYIYGKQNNLYVLRGGIGEKRYFSEKAAEKGVAVGASYRLGPSLGLIKPYYLDININNDAQVSNDRTRPIRYSPETAQQFLDDSRINNNSGFLKGWGEVNPAIGGHAMAALHISWGAFEEYVRAVEAGVMVDFYFQNIPIMVETTPDSNLNQPFFVNIFLNFQFGKRK